MLELSPIESLSQIQFSHPNVLWLLLGIVPLFLLAMFRKTPFPAALLRCLALSLVITALADPFTSLSHDEKEVTALLDLSHSVTPAGQDALLNMLRPILRDTGASLHVLGFAKKSSSRVFSFPAGTTTAAIKRELRSSSPSLDSGDTDLAAALRSAAARTGSSSLLLLSDGRETIGNAREAASELGAAALRVYPLVPDEAPFLAPKLSIASVYAPLVVNAGDFTELRAAVRNSFSEERDATLELWLDKEKLYSQRLTVPPDEERLITMKSPALKGGLHRLRAVLKDGDASLDEAHTWISAKERSKILLLGGAAEDNRVLKELFTLKGYALESIVADGTTSVPTSFDGYSSVILNNIAKHQLPAGFLDSLEHFVAKGGGLLLIGGERSFGLGGYLDTALDRMSPVKFVPPQTKKRRLNSAVVLLIDKSRSMLFENKILAAKKAALATIESMKDDDYVSVIGFDSTPFVIIKIDQVSNVKEIAERRLQNLTAAGQTNLLPALAEARRALARTEVGRKHVIILSDGRVPPAGDAYRQEILSIQNDGGTVSAVAVGVEADVPFLKLMAEYGKGAFYHTLDPSQLAQIFLQDVKVATGEKTLKERQDYPVQLGPDGLQSTTLRSFPPLRGLVETRAKREAKLELTTIDENGTLPVLARWDYDQGPVVAYTSDANGRWSAPWLGWEDFSRFWTQVLESLKTKAPNSLADLDFDLRYSIEKRDVTLDLAIFDATLASRTSPRITAEVVFPSGEIKQLGFQAVRRGRFQTLLENARPGDYKINITYGGVKLPPLAFTLSGQSLGEQSGLGLNVGLLADIAHLTGGAINPRPEQLSLAAREKSERTHHFLPFILLAFLLVLLEAFLRELWLPFWSAARQGLPVQNEKPRPQGNYDRRKFA